MTNVVVTVTAIVVTVTHKTFSAIYRIFGDHTIEVTPGGDINEVGGS